jgi:hypothetical protein
MVLPTQNHWLRYRCGQYHPRNTVIIHDVQPPQSKSGSGSSQFQVVFFCFAQRSRCAAAIRSRASALMVRFFAGFAPRRTEGPSPVSSARACLRSAISESTEERRSVTFMSDSVTLRDRATYCLHPRIARNLLPYYRNNTKEVCDSLLVAGLIVIAVTEMSASTGPFFYDILCGTIRRDR